MWIKAKILISPHPNSVPLSGDDHGQAYAYIHVLYVYLYNVYNIVILIHSYIIYNFTEVGSKHWWNFSAESCLHWITSYLRIWFACLKHGNSKYFPESTGVFWPEDHTCVRRIPSHFCSQTHLPWSHWNAGESPEGRPCWCFVSCWFEDIWEDACPNTPRPGGDSDQPRAGSQFPVAPWSLLLPFRAARPWIASNLVYFWWPSLSNKPLYQRLFPFLAGTSPHPSMGRAVQVFTGHPLTPGNHSFWPSWDRSGQVTNLVNIFVSCCVGFKCIQIGYFN